jgi:hypothetical protein
MKSQGRGFEEDERSSQCTGTVLKGEPPISRLVSIFQYDEDLPRRRVCSTTQEGLVSHSHAAQTLQCPERSRST